MSRSIARLVQHSAANLRGVAPRVLQPDHILPAQFVTPRRARPMPEEALFIAVLEDAINCVCKCRSKPDKYRERRLREEEEWFMSAANDRLFSFERVCEVLGFDAQSVRHAVLGEKCSAKSAAAMGVGA